MEKLVSLIAKSLVNEPDEVEVNKRQDRDTYVIEIKAAEEDLGRIIGRGGKIAQAIRTVTKAAAIKEGVKVRVDISEKE